MKIVGRNTEQELLRECLFSGRPEFLAVYGRRRVGKTFLIKEYFENSFSFYATGVPNQKTAQQLRSGERKDGCLSGRVTLDGHCQIRF